jgi:RHS repeat-associated protein
MPHIGSFARTAARLVGAAIAWLACTFASYGDPPSVSGTLVVFPLPATVTKQLTLPAGPYVDRTLRIWLRFPDGPLVDRGGANWSYTVNLTVTPTDGTHAGTPLPPTSLTIFRDTGHDSFEALAVLGGFSQSQADVAVTPCPPPPTPPSCTGTLPNGITLTAQMSGERDVTFPVTQKPVLSIAGASGSFQLTSVPDGAASYEFEWVYFDTMEPTPSNPFAARDPVRIPSDDPQLKFDVAFPEGTLFARGRAVGRFPGMPDARRPGAWSDPVVVTIKGPNALAHTFNWNYVANYAEGSGANAGQAFFDGNASLTFFDGFLNQRQVQSRVASQSARLVGETKYDAEGRASVAFLSAPADGTGFRYEPKFNAVDRSSGPAGTDTYETAAFDGLVPPPASTSAGAGRYYSASATMSGPADAYVPDAGGYPYTFAQHMRDDTGRTRATGSAGEALRFREGVGHAVGFGYGTASATPLRQLFGHNVGRASYYERNTITDANGQAHVAYVDRAGRTIATALAGDAPDGLESIPDGLESIRPPAAQLVTYRLDENNVVDQGAGVSRSASHITVEDATTNLFFTYDLKGVNYALPGSALLGSPSLPPMCADCRYNLHIKVTGPDGTTVALREGATPQTDANCDQGTGAQQIDKDFPPLPPNACSASMPGADQWSNASEVRFCAKFSAKGEYEVVKELTVDRKGIDAAVARGESTPGYFQPASYRPDATPASSHANVVAPGGSLGTGVCQADCNAFCAEATAGIANHDVQQQTLWACNNSCTNPITWWAAKAVAHSSCESLKQEIDADVAPDGYVGKKHKKHGVPEAQHPEYCHIAELFQGAGLLHSICGRTEASDAYDYRMMAVGSYNDALCGGYLDPLGGTPGAPAIPTTCIAARDHDPFYDPTYIGTSMKAWVAQGMQDYTTVPGFADAWAAAPPPPPGQTKLTLQPTSIWQFAAMAEGPNNAPLSLDEQWHLFRNLYMGLKQMALARHLEDPSGGDYCPYWLDSHAHIKRPDTSGTIANARAIAGGHAADSCTSTCIGLAAQWTASLETACRTKLSDGFETNMRAQFQAYCTAKCALTTPPPNLLPMVTASDIAADAAANGPLSKATSYQPPAVQNCTMIGLQRRCFTLLPPRQTLPPDCTLASLAPADVPPGAAAGPFTVVNSPPAGGGGPVATFAVNPAYQFPPAKPNACTVTVAAAAADAAKELAEQQGRIAREGALDDFAHSVAAAHDANCLGPQLSESFSYQALPGEYHFTLKYYDQADNLVQTVPPAGVHPLSDADANALANGGAVADPPHSLVTTYAYNSLGQVIAQTTPDAGQKSTWYNMAGQARLSQNAQQANEGRYAYVKYDPRARIIETGLVATRGVVAPIDPTKLQTYAEDRDFPQGYTTSEVVQTTYDDFPPSYCQTLKARQPINAANLRGRIAAIVVAPTPSIGAVATCYSYDPHGNITALTQDIPGVATKTIAYDYDILDGKLRAIHYQPGQPDRLDHRFTYDPDRRLLTAETSRDGELWERDAGYSYYRHGPLARLELGADNLQGLDYTYTITGWPKGINADTLNSGRDPGRDGVQGGANAAVPADVFGAAVHYFPRDYTPVGAATLSGGLPQAAASRPTQDPAILAGADCTGASATNCGLYDLGALLSLGCPSGQGTRCGLYDGNVKASVSALANAPGGTIIGSAHRYDQLYRLRESTSFGDVDTAANVWPQASNDPQLWHTQTAYDPNGNIKSLLRCAPKPSSGPPAGPALVDALAFCAKGSGRASPMDDLTYNYPVDAKNAITSNRLTSVGDAVTTNVYGWDLHAQPANNYGYDVSGRLTRDTAAGLDAITWNAASRVATITRASDSIEFIYDGLGNRIAKITRPGPNPATWTRQFFVRDEKGAILATYGQDPAATVKLEDQTIFGGSSRIGLWSAAGNPSAVIPNAAIAVYSRLRGDKQYELANYLGNVEATITDRKTPVIDNGAVTHYEANTVNATGYYPFGMLMPGRLTQAQPQAYRFGYSGLERDDDLKGGGNSYYTNARLFDPRVGRWLSPDPIEVADSSPFVGFANNPLRYADPKGTRVLTPDSPADPSPFALNNPLDQPMQPRDETLRESWRGSLGISAEKGLGLPGTQKKSASLGLDLNFQTDRSLVPLPPAPRPTPVPPPLPPPIVPEKIPNSPDADLHQELQIGPQYSLSGSTSRSRSWSLGVPIQAVFVVGGLYAAKQNIRSGPFAGTTLKFGNEPTANATCDPLTGCQPGVNMDVLNWSRSDNEFALSVGTTGVTPNLSVGAKLEQGLYWSAQFDTTGSISVSIGILMKTR